MIYFVDSNFIKVEVMANKNKVLKLLFIIFLPIMVFANNQTNTEKTQITIEKTQLLGALKLNDNIVLTAEDVTKAKVDNQGKWFTLGTFCTYTNSSDKNISIIATNNEGKFEMIGKNNNSSVQYLLYIDTPTGSERLSYNFIQYGKTKAYKTGGDNNHISCDFPEKVQVYIRPENLAAAKAGIYDISLNLAISDLS